MSDLGTFLYLSFIFFYWSFQGDLFYSMRIEEKYQEILVQVLSLFLYYSFIVLFRKV